MVLPLSRLHGDFVEFRHDSTMLKRALHCARCSVTCAWGAEGSVGDSQLCLKRGF